MGHLKYFNPNPSARYKKDGTPLKWNKNDCSVRAICAVTGLTWGAVFDYLAELAAQHYTMPNDDDIVEMVLKQYGFQRQGFKRGESKPTIDKFCDLHPDGTFVVRVSGHIATIKDGQIWDTWDCGEWAVRSYYVKVDKE